MVTDLQVLNLQDNDITDLPDLIEQLIALKIFNLNYNRITKLPGTVKSVTREPYPFS